MRAFKSPLLRAAAIGLLTLSTAAGCGTEEEFDLSTLAEVTEDDKADKTGNPLVWVRPSAFKLYCFRNPCADKQVAEVNGGTMRLIYKYDWRSLKLSQTAQEDAEKSAGSMLLYGRYATVKVSGEDMTVLQITRANKAVSTKSADLPSTDLYAVTKKPDPTACTMPPCPVLEATALNPKGTVVPTQWDSLDTSRLGLTRAEESTLLTDLDAGKVYLSASVQKGVARISQAFRSIK